MTEIVKCRVCKSNQLRHVLSLGEQALTGVFPMPGETVPSGPLDLVWCQKCTLLQLKQSYSPSEMYGANYGYRSGLNASMVKHLREKANSLAWAAHLQPGHVVLDIGSNDGTFLNAFPNSLARIGMDPTIEKFKQYYDKEIITVPSFFSTNTAFFADRYKPKLVTSIAMFYDLEDPIAFARDVASVLADDGLWHFEQHYMPSMLRTGAYDAICHEHLEFYSLGVIRHILEVADMRIVDVSMNAVNGGSIAVTACKNNQENLTRRYAANEAVVEWLIAQEQRTDLDTLRPYLEFENHVRKHRDDLRGLVGFLVQDGNRISCYGASTKGNVLLQYCGLSADIIGRVYEVNEDKFGRVTPGTNIPIVPEAQLMKDMPDYLLVLPWHFKTGIFEKLTEYRAAGGRVIFPLPEIEVL